MIIPKYTHYLDSDEPVMLIDAHIGFDSEMGMGINGHEFAQELMWLDTLGKNRIRIWINSPGGAVDEGFSIYNAMLMTETPVDTYNIGIAASTAGWIFEAGRRRYINDYAKIMIHNPFIQGDASSSDKKALREIKHSICVAIASRSGHTEEQIAIMMDRETWVNADEALSSGFADEINNSSSFNKKKESIKSMDILSAWQEGAKIFNIGRYIKSGTFFDVPGINTKNQTSMSKILAKSLGLEENATEERILAAITNLKNAVASEAEAEGDTDADGDCVNVAEGGASEMDGLKQRMDEIEKIGKGISDLMTKNEELTKTFSELTKTIDAMKAGLESKSANSDEETYDVAKNSAAVELVDKYITRIGNSDVKVINTWVLKAMADPYKTEHELSQLPLNAKSLAKGISSAASIAAKNEVPVTSDANTLGEWYARQHREKKSNKG